MKTLIGLIILLAANNVLAFDKDNSMGDLQQALMQSNKDYNDSKKVALDADNRRIANWNQQDLATIKIEAGIEAETKDYRMDSEVLEQRKEQKEDLADFEKQKDQTPVLHEVSLNN